MDSARTHSVREWVTPWGQSVTAVLMQEAATLARAVTLFRMYQEKVLVVYEIASAFIGAFSRGLLLSAFSLR
jgi:hypothetical protein